MSKAYTGGCACGAIRYEVPGEPVFMNDCQCRHCQQRSGTGHGSYLTFTGKAQVRLTGEAAHWDVAGDSSNMKTHSFCPTCGAPIYLPPRPCPICSLCMRRALTIPADISRRR
jgi:hypothetical protein